MKSLLSAVLASTMVIAGLVVAPTTSTAQTPPTGSPTPGAAPAPAQPGTNAFPGDDEDAAPDDPASDDLTVRRGRDDQQDDYHHLGGSNIALVRNHSDNRMRLRSRIRLVQIHGDRAEPLNGAFAYASCTDCQTFAVALEIALVSPNASVIAPQNRARALNDTCTRCVTVARAMQYVFVVDDPEQVPDNVDRLMRDMERELRALEHDRDVGAEEANSRVNAVISQFQELASSLQDQLDETVEPSTPGAAPAIEPTLVPAPSPSPSSLTGSPFVWRGPTHQE